MRFTLIALSALAFSSSLALACPNLAGHYACTDQSTGETSLIEISQSEVNGVTQYVFDGQTFIADGQARPIPDDEEVREATLRSWCDDKGQLVNNLVGKVYDNDQYFGDLDVNYSAKIDGNDNLATATDGALTSKDATYPINELDTCIRQKN